MTSLSKLKKDHNYKHFGTPDKHCKTCKHFKHEEAYEKVEGVSADVCRLYRDEDTDAGVTILLEDYGVCDSYE